MILARYDLLGVRVLGDRWDFVVTVRDALGVPVDLTGATVSMVIGHLAPKNATLADQTTAKGQATITYTPTETAAILAPAFGGQYPYRITVSFDANNRDTVAAGY